PGHWQLCEQGQHLGVLRHACGPPHEGVRLPLRLLLGEVPVEVGHVRQLVHRSHGRTLPRAPRRGTSRTLSVGRPTVWDMEVVQDRLGDLGTPLAEVTFVVVDLETTGGSVRDCGITEIGAVKVRGGEVLGELQTFVNPGEPIPAFIQSLTGITDAMVRDAPRTGEAVATFLEFAKGAVLVAHNAGFDIGFLTAACAAHDLRWPAPTVLDTVRLA